MTEFYGVDTALALIAGLPQHNTKAIELSKLEPDLDHAVHHGNVPIAIVVIKAMGEIGWAHVAAIVDGWSVMLDGPRDPGIDQSVHPKSRADIDQLIAAIDRIATPWLAGDHEALGVTDAALAVRIMLRRLDPQQLYKLYISGDLRGPHASISAYRDQVRLPARIGLKRVDGGIEITSGTRTRVIKTMLDLITDFETNELPPIRADVAWSLQFLADVARAKDVATLVMQRAQARLSDHRWSLSAQLETYFSRKDAPAVALTGEGTWNVAGAWFEGVPGGVQIRCAGGFATTVADPRAAESAIEDILRALAASMMVATASSLREGHRYKAKQLLYNAQRGDIVIFRGIEDRRIVEVWKFDTVGRSSFAIDDKDPILERLDEYLEPTP